jgi:hypothetical protein
MDREPGIEQFHWDHRPGGNVSHVAANGVSIEDVEEVQGLAPRYFPNRRGEAGLMLLGANAAGRYLAAIIYPTFEPGVWVVATAYWLERRRAERYYEGGTG